ncbi:uracil-DNA glycosylase family protein [Arvimicrobium flavum]|uniref:uracil-DNA glycosylase family protein n=1 Tax=Arvimicrobium flavum TaxID=3393320 RepID=UPI00237B878A|nr:uracil-DNA glycosylase family protein [Mesorhizobium shangrilense]
MTSDALARLAEEIRACRICISNPLGKPLPHEPRPVVVPSATARILIAGQAPGTKVHATGIPFNDASGDRLRDWMGVTRDEFYDASLFAIVPMGLCFPGQDVKGSDLPPRRECAPAWRGRLLELMPQIELVLAIGGYAQAWHLKEARARTLSETVGNWRQIFASPSSPKILPLPHPSWRNTAWMKKHLWFETDLLPFLRTEIRRRLSPSG